MRLITLIGMLFLAGCGARQEAVSNYRQSLASYKECVRASGPEGCTREKALLDADAQRVALNNGANSGSDTRAAVYQPVGGGTYIRY